MAETTVPYELMSTPEWAEAVQETFRFQASSGDAWDYTGTCPRCHHQVAKRIETGGTAVYRSRDANQVGGMVVRCNCGSDHPGRPDGSKGCGAYAALEIAWP